MPGYTYPGTDIPQKQARRDTHDELEGREAPYVAARRIEIEAGHGPPLQLDAEHLKALHRHLFQDVYDGPATHGTKKYGSATGRSRPNPS